MKLMNFLSNHIFSVKNKILKTKVLIYNQILSEDYFKILNTNNIIETVSTETVFNLLELRLLHGKNYIENNTELSDELLETLGNQLFQKFYFPPIQSTRYSKLKDYFDSYRNQNITMSFIFEYINTQYFKMEKPARRNILIKFSDDL